jgi:hypothetical protein
VEVTTTNTRTSLYDVFAPLTSFTASYSAAAPGHPLLYPPHLIVFYSSSRETQSHDCHNMRSIYSGASRPSGQSKCCRITNASMFLLFTILWCSQVVSGFIPHATSATSTSASRLQAVETLDDEVARQLKRAKEVLAKTKAKIDAKAKLLEDMDNDPQEAERKSNLPFFASEAVEKVRDKREKVIKSKNEEGLVTTDGALMAELSEDEEWEARPLLDVFKSESKNSKDSTLADRDVAASIFGLQRVLQTEDFQKIFDKRNRFIGDQ